MKVLVACEFSGVVRSAFSKRGHYAVSADFEQTERSGLHYRGDVLNIIDRDWDLIIAHPPCTYLSYVGARWFKTQPDRAQKREDALIFFKKMLDAKAPMICVENPKGWARLIREPDQKIQPYQFGEPYSKETWLWLKGLAPLKHTKVLTKYYVNWVGYGVKNSKDRSRTFPGIALAMAEQWG